MPFQVSRPYRSIVNVGEGPRVLGFQHGLLEAPGKAWDRLDGSDGGWAGEFYAHLCQPAVRSRDHFQSEDVRYATPEHKCGIDPAASAQIAPFLAYEGNSGDGRGVTTFISDGIDYPVANLLDPWAQRHTKAAGGKISEQDRQL